MSLWAAVGFWSGGFFGAGGDVGVDRELAGWGAGDCEQKGVGGFLLKRLIHGIDACNGGTMAAPKYGGLADKSCVITL